MWAIKSKSLVPPGGWLYKCPTTGTEITATTYPNIADKVRKFCEANGFPFSEHSMDQVLCEHAHEIVCVGVPDGPARPRMRTMSFDDVLRGTKVILALKTRGKGQLVPAEEAEERSKTCASCSFNMEHEKKCPGICKQLEKVITALVGGAKTERDAQLKSCQVCGCVNKAQVWVPYDILRVGVTAEMDTQWPEYCWKRPKD